MSENARKMAALGETLRQHGNYSDAIEYFNRAIDADKKYWWAYAHRAAARGALGDFEGAFEDFDNSDVVDYYRKHNWRWFYAQKGEVYRLWAMAATSRSEESEAQRSSYLQASRLNLERFHIRQIDGSQTENPWKLLSVQAIDLFTTALDGPGPEGPRPDGSAPAGFKLEGSRPEGARPRRSRVNNPWILAHRGATYTMRCWIMTDMPGVMTESERALHAADTFDADFKQADQDLSEAIALNPTYGWAYLFRAVLHAIPRDSHAYDAATTNKTLAEKIMGSMQQGIETSMLNIGRAQMSGLDRDLAMTRIMMELSIYTGGDMAELARRLNPGTEAGHHAKTKATRTLREGVQLAWRTLQIESDETFARYFVANGLQQLSELHGTNDPMVPVAIKRARAALEGMHARYLAMSGGLDCMEGEWEKARAKLDKIRNLRDLQAVSIVNRDPAWARLPPKR